MGVKFHKMHGAGNDFVLLDLREQSFTVGPETAAALSNRQTGIGCDQVLVLRKPATGDCIANFEVWNADGSRAEQCGNGVRCIGLYLDSRGEAPPGVFEIRGPVATMEVECLGDGQVRVNMGAPGFDPGAIPIRAERAGEWYEIRIGTQTVRIGAVSMGNPHALLQVDEIFSARVAELGPAIIGHAAFPRGCNAGFVEVLDRENIRLRVFERGAGETLACGSGACAAVAILHRAKTVGHKVLVNQVGGSLIIEWSGSRNPVMMTGPACHVFEGYLK
jgi:diaminopimelate epimerase